MPIFATKRLPAQADAIAPDRLPCFKPTLLERMEGCVTPVVELKIGLIPAGLNHLLHKQWHRC